MYCNVHLYSTSSTVNSFWAQKSSRFLWGFVFWITSGLYVIGVTYFGVFGSGEQQTWGRVASERGCEDFVKAAPLQSPNGIEEGGGEEAKLEAHYERTTLELDIASEERAIVERMSLNADQKATA